jgi:DNA-binding transcriptional MerR regulator
MAKSPDAFRTISEVAEWLGVPTHVLRFWESKFSQVKPIKRAGGRRYYRPADMLLLGGIKLLLHDKGLTIKGVQKILREQGVAHVADLSQSLDDMTMAVLLDAVADPNDEAEDTIPEAAMAVDVPEAKAESAEVLAFDTSAEQAVPALQATTEISDDDKGDDDDDTPTSWPEEITDAAPDGFDTDETDDELAANAEQTGTEDAVEQPPESENDTETYETQPLPGFLRHPLSRKDAISDENAPSQENASTQSVAGTTPRPAAVDAPPLPAESDMPATASALSASARLRSLTPSQSKALRPLLTQLAHMRKQMAQAQQDARKD